MCIDFTDMNDICPNDYFPLSRIDTLIDVTTGHEMLSFMDEFGAYNQIKMHRVIFLRYHSLLTLVYSVIS